MDRYAALALVTAVVFGASCGSSSETSKQAPATSGDEATKPSLRGHMSANFDLALKARDGIIAGSMIQAREAAVQLAEQDYSVVLPPEWMPGVERMQAAARELTAASDLAAGAADVAALAATCGECHASFEEHDHGRPVETKQTAFGEAEDMHGRMLRHQQAAEGFWYGLTMPSDAAWRSGAVALTAAPASPTDKDGKPIDAAMLARLEDVRGIARRALEAEGSQTRAAVYAELLAQCSSCHSGGAAPVTPATAAP